MHLFGHLGVSWTKFSFLREPAERYQQIYSFGTAPIEQKSQNQWPKVAPELICVAIFMDFELQVGIDFFTFFEKAESVK